MRVKGRLVLLGLSLSLLIAPASALRADPISASDFSGSESVIDFEGFSLLTNLDGASVNGATFLGTTFVVAAGALDGNSAIALDASGTVRLDFDSPVRDVGMDFVHGGASSPLYIDAFGAGGFIDSVAVSGGTGFLGIGLDEDILYIEIHNAGGAFQIDNILYEGLVSVPEPATLLMFGAGLGGLALASRRKRKKID